MALGSAALSIAWMAIATGVAGLLALVLILLFFKAGQPFGTLNDLCIGAAAILSAAVAWMLYPAHYAQSPLLSQVAVVSALAGALVVAVGSGLVIFRVTGWYLAGLYLAAGNALIGLWLLGINASAQAGGGWPQGLVVFGLIVGGIMTLGLVAIPGLVRRIDAWDAAPWYVNYIGQAGGLGWLVLYPLWCLWLGRMLLGA